MLYPALPSFAGHAIWKRDFSGASGLMSFVMDGGGKDRAFAFLDALEIFGLGYSWGGYESLAVMSSLADRRLTGGGDQGPVIRLQIGLEDADDLIGDIRRGLEAAAASSAGRS